MATEVGMDTGLIREFATKLDQSAQQLATVISSVTAIVGRIQSVWVGPDANEFVGWWNNQHRPALQSAHDSVAGLAQSARNNASAQDTVSDTHGGIFNSPTMMVVPPAVAGIAAAAASAAAAAATGAAAAAREAVVARFTAAYPVGSTVGSGECVGLFEKYTVNYNHTSEFYTKPFDDAAYDLYTHYHDIPGLSAAYQQIPAGSTPQPGDVVVWGPSLPGSQGYGHVAICTGQSGESFSVLQQNAVRHKVSTGTYSLKSGDILGYLRPNNLS